MQVSTNAFLQNSLTVPSEFPDYKTSTLKFLLFLYTANYILIATYFNIRPYTHASRVIPI
jgi:hypothetical protein